MINPSGIKSVENKDDNIHRSSGKSSHNSLKIQNTPPIPAMFSSIPKPAGMASLSNSRWQIRKERQNQSINNGDMFDKANRSTVNK